MNIVAGFPKFYEATKVSSTQHFQPQAELQDKSTNVVADVSMFYEATKVSSTRQQKSVLRSNKGQFYAALPITGGTPVVGVSDEPYSEKPAQLSSHTGPPGYI